MSTTDLAQQVADLTTATTQLTQEVVGQKARLTAAADTATDKASDASGSASSASASATSANAAAAEAETSKNQAAEISGLDTVEEAVDLALSKYAGVMTETEAMAQTDAYEQMFAASGMVHNGFNGSNNVVNVGLYSSSTVSDAVLMGRNEAESSGVQTSKTPFPQTYLAGVISNFLHCESDGRYHSNTFLLAPASAGTDVYDSTGDVRGSGKATLDLRYEVDPKYGDIPTGSESEILNEAVARAFEHQVKNGDFRNGSEDWNSWSSVSGGKATKTADSTSNVQAFSSLIAVKPNTEYEVSFIFDESSTTYGVVYASTSDNSSGGLGSSGNMNPAQPDDVGIRKFTFNSGSNTQVRIVPYVLGVFGAGDAVYSQFSVRPLTEEVVTHRVDLLAWESYPEELTGRTEIFECIQSLGTTFGDTDVPTVLSTRPLSYFQQYEGQFADPSAQNNRYRCVVWDDLDDKQKRKVAAYMGNKLYIKANGNLVNRRLRALCIKGMGNGDWRDINSATNGNKTLGFGDALNTRVVCQAVLDAPSNEYSSRYYANTLSDYNNDEIKHQGVWTSRPDIHGGKSYLYVVTTVPRANQGAYHPDLNQYGCSGFGTAADPAYSFHWHYSAIVSPKTARDCFMDISGGGSRSNNRNAGSISGGDSEARHPDGIFYDGITAGGLNGMIDWRLPAVANDTPEEQAKVQMGVENGTYRGLEKPLATVVVPVVDYAGRDASRFTLKFNRNLPHVNNIGGIKMCAVEASTKQIIEFTVTQTSDHADGGGVRNITYAEGGYKHTPLSTGSWNFVYAYETAASFSGYFSTSMVIADPVDILETDAIKGGWLGTWYDWIPDGSPSHRAKLSRTFVEIDNNPRLYSTDLGHSWVKVSADPNSTLNTVFAAGTAGSVQVIEYKAAAKVTKPSEVKPLYNGTKGVMDVFYTMRDLTDFGRLFAESLIDEVLVSSFVDNHKGWIPATYLNFNPVSGLMYDAVHHAPLILDPPVNDSKAMKVLPHQIAENGQCSIAYQANELTYEPIDASSVTQVLDGAASTSITEGEWYAFNGVYFLAATTNPSVQFGGLILDESDNSARFKNSGTLVATYGFASRAGSWGDDGKIKVTSSGTDGFIDLNNNSNKSVAHELAMKSGWTQKRARVGTQVEGIDL